MRDGVNMYIFSAHGHGRVGIVGGCLLGRMYVGPVDQTVLVLRDLVLTQKCSHILGCILLMQNTFSLSGTASIQTKC